MLMLVTPSCRKDQSAGGCVLVRGGTKPTGCSRDRVESGRCLEEVGPAQGDSWDQGRGLKQPEKPGGVGGGARRAQALGGEDRVSRWGSGRGVHG